MHRRHYDTLVLDQGPLQSAWCVLLDGELREEGALRAAVHDLLADGCFAFAFVHVDVTPELAADRIAPRGAMAPPFHRGRAETLRLLTAHRQHFARRVRALTAQARTSAYVLISLPFVVGLGLTAIDYSYMAPLYQTGAGRFMLALALVLLILGIVTMRRVVQIRV